MPGGVERSQPGPATASPGERLSGLAIIAGVRLLRALPDGIVYRAAFGLGVALSFVLRSRRRLLTANLLRVCRWLDDQGMAGPRVAAAARDRHALQGLARAAFGHWVTTYAETALAPGYDAAMLRQRVRLERPEIVREALAPIPPGGIGRIYVGLHFGAVELAGLYATLVGHVPVGGPMETLANPVLRDYFERTRRALGADLIPLEEAAVQLRDRLARGLGIGVVADRVITGSGSRVELFGAPYRLPAGPAVLAVESGARLFVISLRRDARPGRWIGALEEIEVPAEGSRRERARAVLEAQARWIERTVAHAPEQWWALLFPAWEDIQ